MIASDFSRITLAAGLLALHLVALDAMLQSPAAFTRPGETLRAVAVQLIGAGQTSYEVPVVRGTTTEPQGPLPDDGAAPTAPHALAAQPEKLLFNGGLYLPSSKMDRRPTPVSEPDITHLRGLRTSGLPVRLRIYIDRTGKVTEVLTLEAGLFDEEFAEGLHKMFRATAFLPGRLDGADVATFLEIELTGR